MSNVAPPPAPPTWTKRIKALRLERYLLTGLLTLLPLWLTWTVFKFVFALLASVSKPWIEVALDPIARSSIAFRWLAADWFQSSVALVATLVFIYAVGVFTTRVVGQRFLVALDALMERIPLVKQLYGGTKKLIDLLQTKPDHVQRVVLIDFPNATMKTVGLVTRTFRDENSGREYAAVYVPTTPNPTSGYLEIVPVEKITQTDWTMDQAMAFIISGGAIAPETVRIDPPAADRATKPVTIADSDPDAPR